MRRACGQYLTYGARVQREVDKAVRRAEAVVEEEGEVAAAAVAEMAATAAAGWMAFAGSGEISGPEKDVCRRRWRTFISSGRIEPQRRLKATTAPGRRGVGGGGGGGGGGGNGDGVK